jgi:hypothetical protein
MADARRTERGSALTAAMILSGALVPLAAYVLLRAELDVLVQEHTRRSLEAFFVAESGLAHALADLSWDPSFERLGAGPDGRPGTADDALYPFRDPPPPFFPAPPSRYRVEVERVDGSTCDVVSYGIGIGLSSRVVLTRVRGSPAPYVPAATFTAHPEVIEVSDSFVVQGGTSSLGADVPAVATEDDPDVNVILARLSAAARAHLIGPGGSPSVAKRGFRALGGITSAIARLAGATPLPETVQGTLGFGVFSSAQSTDVGNSDGSGVLVVDGNLRVNGHFVFAGLVLVGGDVLAEPGSSLEISGALLQGRPGRALRLAGDGTIAYDAAALAAADTLSGHLLPRRALIGAWREKL